MADRERHRPALFGRRWLSRFLLRLAFVPLVFGILDLSGVARNAGDPPSMIPVVAFVALILLHLVLRMGHSGAQCPRCHGFAVRHRDRLGVVFAKDRQRCDDCGAEFGERT